MSLPIAAGVGGVVSGLFGLGGAAMGARQAQKGSELNYEAQMQTNAQNEALMREGWQRDDTAYQRRVKDLRAAGLNPLLATGQSVSNSQPVSMVAGHPGAGKQQQAGISERFGQQLAQGVPSAVSTAMNLMSLKAQEEQINQTKAQTALIEAQTGLVPKHAESIDSSIRKQGQEIKESMQRVSQSEEEVNRILADTGLKLSQGELNEVRKRVEELNIDKTLADINNIVTNTAHTSADIDRIYADTGLKLTEADLVNLKKQMSGHDFAIAQDKGLSTTAPMGGGVLKTFNEGVNMYQNSLEDLAKGTQGTLDGGDMVKAIGRWTGSNYARTYGGIFKNAGAVIKILVKGMAQGVRNFGYRAEDVGK